MYACILYKIFEWIHNKYILYMYVYWINAMNINIFIVKIQIDEHILNRYK